jgi:hypothetical protein
MAGSRRRHTDTAYDRNNPGRNKVETVTTMIRILVSVLVGSVLFNACGGGAAQTDAQRVASALTGDDKQAAANNPQCKLFTRAEVAQYVGEPVSAGRNATGGMGLPMGCGQWREQRRRDGHRRPSAVSRAALARERIQGNA